MKSQEPFFEMLKKNYSISILISALIVVIGFLSYGWGNVNLLGSIDEYKVGVYSDVIQNDLGNTSQIELKSKNPIEYTYTLTKDLDEPFAACFVNFDSTQTFPFCDYSTLRLHIYSENSRKIPVTITLRKEGFTKPNNQNYTSIPYNTVIEYKEPGIYVLQRSDFKIQSWWLRHHGLNPEDFKHPDFCKADHIVFGSGQALKKGKEDSIRVAQVKFTNHWEFQVLLYALLIVLFNAVFWVTVYIKKKKSKVIPVLVQEKSGDLALEIKDRVIQYISENYQNSELSQEDIAKEVGTTSRRIGSILKEEFGLGFKAYLNKIRLSAVTHFLKNTEDPIAQIAYECGYNNISHFNRVFKETFGVSPQTYREQKE